MASFNKHVALLKKGFNTRPYEGKKGFDLKYILINDCHEPYYRNVNTNKFWFAFQTTERF